MDLIREVDLKEKGLVKRMKLVERLFDNSRLIIFFLLVVLVNWLFLKYLAV